MQNKKILDYTLLRLLGKGGMAEVWYAENDIEKPAAVKILNEDLSHNAQIVERFRNEAKITVKLNHPNIRQVYEYDEIDGRPCMVMEYLEGDDLSSRMKHGERFTDEQLKKWWNQLASALNYTHAQGVVHRDIKPSNIFIDREGNVKLLDFGIAKVRDSITSTATGATMGTLMYMSPEQADAAKHVDWRSDIYSLAVSFVSLMQSHAPYNEQTESQRAILNHIAEHPLDLTGVPAEWQSFLQPYLAKNPAERPALTEFGVEASPVDFVPPVTPLVAPSAPVSEETFVGSATVASASATDEGTMAETPSAQTQSQPQPRKAWPWILAACAVVVCVVLWGCSGNHKVDDAGGQNVVNEAQDSTAPSPLVEEAAAPTPEAIDNTADVASQMETTANVPKTENREETVSNVPAGYVDLGLSVYWKASNEWNSSDDHGFYTYDEAKSRFSSKLPTKAQYQELLNKCTWKWNGNGYKVTGPNGQSITLPAAGFRNCCDGEVNDVGSGGELNLVGSDGYYWSSTPYWSIAWYLSFGSGCHYMDASLRCFGRSVRLVQGK